jgi:hypothetical protein
MLESLSEQRGLVTVYSGVNSQWTGLALTDHGVRTVQNLHSPNLAVGEFRADKVDFAADDFCPVKSDRAADEFCPLEGNHAIEEFCPHEGNRAAGELRAT